MTTIKDEIKEVLSTGKKTTQEIKNYILKGTGYAASSIDVTLWEMNQDGDVVRLERGVYALPHQRNWFERLKSVFA